MSKKALCLGVGIVLLLEGFYSSGAEGILFCAAGGFLFGCGLGLMLKRY